MVARREWVRMGKRWRHGYRKTGENGEIMETDIPLLASYLMGRPQAVTLRSPVGFT